MLFSLQISRLYLYLFFITSIKNSYYPNVTGEKYDGTPMVHVLSEQIVSPVLLYKTFKNMVDDGVTRFLEIGPGGVLSTILEREFEGLEVSTIKNDDDLIELLEA